MKRTLSFITIRLIEAMVIFFITISIIFFLLYMIPGRIGVANDVHQSSDDLTSINSQAGITGNIIVDYGYFLKNALIFNFGKSISIHPGLSIGPYVWRKLVTSMSFAAISVTLSVLLAIPIAILMARKPNKFLDSFGLFFISIAIALPAFIFAILLMILGQKFGLPIAFEFNDFRTWILPIVALTFGGTASQVIFIRSEIITNKNSQFIKFSEIKGIKRKRIEYLHVIKQSMFSTITFLPISFVGTLMSSILVENIFAIPGIGGLLASSITAKDFTVLQAILTLTILLTLASFTVRDISYTLLDPRLRVR